MERKLLLGIEPGKVQSSKDVVLPQSPTNPKEENGTPRKKKKIKIISTPPQASASLQSVLPSLGVSKVPTDEKGDSPTSSSGGESPQEKKTPPKKRGEKKKLVEDLKIQIEGVPGLDLVFKNSATFTISSLKEFLCSATGYALFQLKFEVNKIQFLGIEKKDDRKLLKTFTVFKAQEVPLPRFAPPLPSQQFFGSFWLEDLFSQPPKAKPPEPQLIVKVIAPDFPNVASFMRGVRLQKGFGDNYANLGRVEVVQSSDGGCCQAVPKILHSPSFIIFKIRRSDKVQIKLDKGLFKLSQLSREEKKIKRTEVPIGVDSATLVYAANFTATVVATVPTELEEGIYEVSFGFDSKEVSVKEFLNFKFKDPGYTAWFILGRRSVTTSLTTDELTCTSCLEDKMHQNHFVCGVCLGVECVKCVSSFHSKHKRAFVCQSCHNSMFRQ
jgi:hypothetical protein